MRVTPACQQCYSREIGDDLGDGDEGGGGGGEATPPTSEVGACGPSQGAGR
jgi:hypothetical protein